MCTELHDLCWSHNSKHQAVLEPARCRTGSCRLVLARRCSYALCLFTFTLIKINKQTFIIYSSRSH